MGLITFQYLKKIKYSEEQLKQLVRFIGEEGISPLEFTRLPVEQFLSEQYGNPAIREKLIILLQKEVLSKPLLFETGVFTAELALHMYEKIIPGESGFRNVFNQISNFSKGTIPGNARRRKIQQEINELRTTTYSDSSQASIYFIDAINHLTYNIYDPFEVARLTVMAAGFMVPYEERNAVRAETWQKIYDFICERLEAGRE